VQFQDALVSLNVDLSLIVQNANTERKKRKERRRTRRRFSLIWCYEERETTAWNLVHGFVLESICTR
jgi:hypothetical protein